MLEDTHHETMAKMKQKIISDYSHQLGTVNSRISHAQPEPSNQTSARYVCLLEPEAKDQRKN
jgi:hypothetical protein